MKLNDSQAPLKLNSPFGLSLNNSISNSNNSVMQSRPSQDRRPPFLKRPSLDPKPAMQAQGSIVIRKKASKQTIFTVEDPEIKQHMSSGSKLQLAPTESQTLKERPSELDHTMEQDVSVVNPFLEMNSTRRPLGIAKKKKKMFVKRKNHEFPEFEEPELPRRQSEEVRPEALP